MLLRTATKRYLFHGRSRRGPAFVRAGEREDYSHTECIKYHITRYLLQPVGRDSLRGVGKSTFALSELPLNHCISK
jgi:hypothetical protein